MRHGPCERPLGVGEDDRDCEEVPGSYPWIMAAAILGSAIAFIDGSVVSIALPSIRGDLGASLGEMQWIVNGYALMLAAFILPGGSAGDVFGRKRVFLVGVAVYTASSLWAGLAGSSASLVIARIVEGAGGALMIPASLALITEHVPKARRGRAIGLWSAASAAATSLGPLLGGVLVDAAGWRPALLLTVPFGVLTFVIAYRGVPRSDPDGNRMDWTGGALVCLALGGLAYWLTEVSTGVVTDGLFAGLAGAALLAGFLWHQAAIRHPMMPLSLFREAAFSVANGQTFFLYGALAGALTFLPVVLIDAHGYSATSAGLVMLPFALIIAGLSQVAGAAADRVGARILLVAGPGIVAIGFLLLAWVAVDGGFWTSVMPAMAVLGIGMGITVAPISTTVMNAAPDDQAGTASGVNNAISRAAGLIGLPIFGLLGQIGFRATTGEGTFGEPGSLGTGYAGGMETGLVWISLGCAALAALSAAIALQLPGDRSPDPAPA